MDNYKNKISGWLSRLFVELAKTDLSSGFYIYSPEEAVHPEFIKSLELLSVDPLPDAKPEVRMRS